MKDDDCTKLFKSIAQRCQGENVKICFQHELEDSVDGTKCALAHAMSLTKPLPDNDDAPAPTMLKYDELTVAPAPAPAPTMLNNEKTKQCMSLLDSINQQCQSQTGCIESKFTQHEFGACAVEIVSSIIAEKITTAKDPTLLHYNWAKWWHGASDTHCHDGPGWCLHNRGNLGYKTRSWSNVDTRKLNWNKWGDDNCERWVNESIGRCRYENYNNNCQKKCRTVIKRT